MSPDLWYIPKAEWKWGEWTLSNRMRCLTVSANIYSAVSLIQLLGERWWLVEKERVVELGVDGRKMESLVDIIDLLCPSLSP